MVLCLLPTAPGPPSRETRKSSVISVISVTKGPFATRNILASKGLRPSQKTDRDLPN
jgi:hypothetical protein